ATRYGTLQCQDKDELLPLLQALMSKDIPKAEGKSVGIIGSGPAGLAAAHDLALLGFSVTIYEMERVLAGMLALGVPEYRLPRDVIRAEVEVITALGVEAVTNCTVGVDVTMPELRQRHDAVIIAAGARLSAMLPIPGADAKGVLGGVEFLHDVALGKSPELGNRIVVIGGGNVAYDVGRTVVRQASMDTARTARRAQGVSEVHLCSLESLEEMPADDVEIIEGSEEGIVLHNSAGPKEIETDADGNVTGVVFKKCLRVFDEDRRFDPQYDESETFTISCDSVLLSVGQSFDISFIDAERDGLKISGNGLIECDPVTGTTNQLDVFVAGDLAYGPKLLIHAVASGKSVARAIYERCTGRSISSESVELHFPLPQYHREPDYEKIPRIQLKTASAAERIERQDLEVELGLSCEDARREASRCLNCGVNTIFDGTKCILCGGCVEICPELCIHIVPATDVMHKEEVREVVARQLAGCPPEEASAIIKDETRCIRCALCAERCPTGAITMEHFHFEENLLCRVD
ncbi:MAG: FAD-dependent oxidoreductase, partial [Candidatus Hydrogenedentes bacterium]|nr:FAD-dependent oxidoreductase [Candidatus Hydrogenedentota bacterium]